MPQNICWNAKTLLLRRHPANHERMPRRVQQIQNKKNMNLFKQIEEFAHKYHSKVADTLDELATKIEKKL